MLDNGIGFAATYFIMLLVLLFIGGGRWLSRRGGLKPTLLLDPDPDFDREGWQ